MSVFTYGPGSPEHTAQLMRQSVTCPECGGYAEAVESGPVDRQGRTVVFWECEDCGWRSEERPGSGVL